MSHVCGKPESIGIRLDNTHGVWHRNWRCLVRAIDRLRRTHWKVANRSGWTGFKVVKEGECGSSVGNAGCRRISIVKPDIGAAFRKRWNLNPDRRRVVCRPPIRNPEIQRRYAIRGSDSKIRTVTLGVSKVEGHVQGDLDLEVNQTAAVWIVYGNPAAILPAGIHPSLRLCRSADPDQECDQAHHEPEGICFWLSFGHVQLNHSIKNFERRGSKLHKFVAFLKQILSLHKLGTGWRPGFPGFAVPLQARSIKV